MSQQTPYDKSKAASYWGEERFQNEHDEAKVVLGLNQPTVVLDAFEQWELAWLKRFLPDLRGRTLLDIACGVGRLTVHMARREAEVTGVDLAPGMLARARRRLADRGLEATLVNAPAMDMPFADGSFDVVMCMGLLEHLPRELQRAAIDEATRVLKPGGDFVVETTNLHSKMNKDDNPYRKAQQLENGYFCDLVDPDAVRDQLRAKGFKVLGQSSNTFFSLVRHTHRRRPGAVPDPVLKGGLQLALQLDNRRKANGGFDRNRADQFIIHARKPTVSIG